MFFIRKDAFVVEKSTGDTYRIITVGTKDVELESTTGKYMNVTKKQLKEFFRSA